jgi:hypothetical protein
MAQRKSTRKSAATARKKTPTSRTSPARKAAGKSARKAPAKTARKAAAKTPRKAAAKTPRKAPAKTARKAAAKTPRKAAAKMPPNAVSKAAPAASKTPERFQRTQLSPSRARPPAVAPDSPPPRVDRSVITEEQVETTSAGIQPLAPEHAPVDDLTSTGNELLDIFQRYDRNRTGSIEQPEFARLLEALGQNINDEELAIAFDIIDTERTGKISWKQFKNWWTSR